jgi:serine/threonine protein kinase/Tfp pilus assembly protein PilF
MDEILGPLRTELSDRYEIEHELGRGGMAIVYLARDLRHHRRVAIKVLRPDVEMTGAGERFLREIRTAAQLHHPHILALYDSGSAGGHLFYVMPYVEGESVRQRLEREGQLPVDVAVKLTCEVADALDFAHQHGVVHRDIKPENILISAGHAIVADFGIASAADAAGFRLTETGMALGTPSYMSPEQATADPRVDGRADQYALACVLYEMLAGSPPFSGANSQAVMARHTRDPVPSLATVRAVDPALEFAIRRALAKAASDRWATAGNFAAALDAATSSGSGGTAAAISSRRFKMGSAAVAAILVVAIAVSSFTRTSNDSPDAAGEGEVVKSVAVLPFTYSGDTARSVLADGLTEGLITGLVRVPGLRVPSNDRVRGYRDQNKDPLDIARELNVAAIVSAGVQVAGNRLRVTAQLVDAGTGVLMWRESFDGELLVDGMPRDLFSIQDDMAGKIVSALQPRLNPTTRAVASQGMRTKDLEAYSLYQQARRVIAVRTIENLTQATTLLRRAVERDSTFADAWALLHEMEVSARTASGRPPSEAAAAVDGLLDRAIRYDSLSANVFLTRSQYRMYLKWDPVGAASDLARAVALGPGNKDVALVYSWFLAGQGKMDSAIRYARQAWSADPESPSSWADLAYSLYMAGETDSAIAVYEQAVRLDSTLWTNYYTGMHAYFDKGQRARADAAAEKFLRLGGYRVSQALAYASVHYRRSGDMKKIRELSDSISAMSKRQYVSPSEIATVRLALGDKEGALDALEQAARDRDVMLADNLRHTLSPLRGEPRFEAVRRMVYGNHPMPRFLFP